MSEITLRIAEAAQRHVGKGIAVVDPKVVEDNDWETGQILELVGNRKSHVKLWPGSAEQYGTGTIKIDGITRHNIGAGIGEKISVKSVDAAEADQVTVSPIEKLGAEGLQEYMQINYFGHVLTTGDTLIVTTQLGGKTQLVITSTTPSSKPVIVTEQTKFKLGSMTKAIDNSVPRITYDDLGGLKNEVQKIREMVELPMRYPELFEKLGVEAPKGVLLYGPPGTGKTLLAKAVANESNAHFISISGPEIMSKFYGESEARLREIFKEAKEKSPSIIFIDEIDSIAPKREEVTGEVERRVVSQLLSLMDGLEARGKVIVISATNRPNAIDPALRRPGRFDREIEIKVPDKKGRLEILQIHTRHMPLQQDVDIERLAAVSHGFVGADLEYLCKEAAMKTLRRMLPELKLEEDRLSPEVLDKLIVTAEDFDNALKDVMPSAMREVYLETPDVKWSEIGGLEGVKKELQEAVEWPLKYPELYKTIGYNMPKGILLHGPSGTGKTLLAKAVATESEANFISVRGPELLSKWVGESERGVREVFRRARQASPCIIFFDEVDALAPTRGMGGDSMVTERVVSQLLTELDGIQSLQGVVVLAATNRIDIVDSALLRAGRFDKVIIIPMPDKEARREVLKIHMKGKPIAKDVDVDTLVEITEGFSGADIAAIVNTAVSLVLQEFLSRYPKPEEAKKHAEEAIVTAEHFQRAVKKVRSSREGKPMEKVTVPYYR